MKTQNHPNPANITNRIDRMLRMIDPGGTDQNALGARTSIHAAAALHPPVARAPGRMHGRQLLATVITFAMGVLGASMVVGLLTAVSPPVVTSGQQQQPLFEVPEDKPDHAYIQGYVQSYSQAAETTDPSLVSAAVVWAGNTAAAEEPVPSF